MTPSVLGGSPSADHISCAGGCRSPVPVSPLTQTPPHSGRIWQPFSAVKKPPPLRGQKSAGPGGLFLLTAWGVPKPASDWLPPRRLPGHWVAPRGTARGDRRAPAGRSRGVRGQEELPYCRFTLSSSSSSSIADTWGIARITGMRTPDCSCSLIIYVLFQF